MAFTLNKTGSGFQAPVIGFGSHSVAHNYVDFTVTANQLGNGEIMAIFAFPAYTWVRNVSMYIPTADAHITDVDIGTATAAEAEIDYDGFMDGVSLAATGMIQDTAGEPYTPPTGYFGSVSFYITFMHNIAATLDEAKIHFFAEYNYLGSMVAAVSL